MLVDTVAKQAELFKIFKINNNKLQVLLEDTKTTMQVQINKMYLIE